MSTTVETANEIRPFHVDVPEEELADLRRRIAATRWPEKETVADHSQGVPLAMTQELANYWATDYDWRKCEAKLNALPQFITEIDGLDIHFMHVRSQHEDALPLIVNHGWPGSIIEQLKIIDRLTDPTAHGASASDGFHVVIPSMPGYGFSGKPTSTGWGPERMGRAWAELMRRLGYDRYVAQGGDWGAFVVDQMGLQAPDGLLAIHTNMPATVPADVDEALQAGAEGRMVRGRPRGAWTSRHHTWESARLWWPDGVPALNPAEARIRLVEEYLRRFGPATEADVAWWTGWSLRQTRTAIAGAATATVTLTGGPGLVLDGRRRPRTRATAGRRAVARPGSHPDGLEAAGVVPARRLLRPVRPQRQRRADGRGGTAK